MKNAIRALPKTFWWSVASLLVMVVGAFGPWAEVEDLITIHGTDGGRDGWVIVGAAVVGALSLLAYARFRRGWLLVLPLLAGLGGAATAAYDISDLESIASSNPFFSSIVKTGWGLYVALGASISLALASIALFVEGRQKKGVPLEEPSTA
jgi:hypothetical protein